MLTYHISWRGMRSPPQLLPVTIRARDRAAALEALAIALNARPKQYHEMPRSVTITLGSKSRRSVSGTTWRAIGRKKRP